MCFLLLKQQYPQQQQKQQLSAMHIIQLYVTMKQVQIHHIYAGVRLYLFGVLVVHVRIFHLKQENI